jgi:hypothetical protein
MDFKLQYNNQDIQADQELLGVFINNSQLFMFDRDGYSIGRQTVEEIEHVGRTSLIHTLSSYPDGWSEKSGFNEGFIIDSNSLTTVAGFTTNKENTRKLEHLRDSDPVGQFQVSIHLK